jgi:S1-C subfamily serine protease
MHRSTNAARRGRFLLTLLACTMYGDHASGHDALVSVFDRVNPAVVVIYTVERQARPAGGGEVTAPGLGSGVLIDKNGHIATAAHVVQTADLVEVEFLDGSKVSAAVVSSDPSADLALLKIDAVPRGIKPVPLANSAKVAVGTEVFVVGAPYGLGHSLTVGHISGRIQNDGTGLAAPEAELFQSDTAINQGNSGGPMFNMDGEVVGIVSYILSKSGGFEGLGFAVTANTFRERLLENPPFWSGMAGVMLRGAMAQALNVPQPYGLLVQRVALGSPAQKMGLQASKVPVTIEGQTILIGGDVLLAIGGTPITPASRAEIQDKIQALSGQNKLVIDVLRGGQVEQIDFYGFYKTVQ